MAIGAYLVETSGLEPPTPCLHRAAMLLDALLFHYDELSSLSRYWDPLQTAGLATPKERSQR